MYGSIRWSSEHEFPGNRHNEAVDDTNVTHQMVKIHISRDIIDTNILVVGTYQQNKHNKPFWGLDHNLLLIITINLYPSNFCINAQKLAVGSGLRRDKG